MKNLTLIAKPVTGKVNLTPLITDNNSVTDPRKFAATNNRNKTVTSGSNLEPPITGRHRLLPLSICDSANNRRARP